MKILGLREVEVAPEWLLDAPRNANAFEQPKFEQFKLAIAQEGFLQPILVREIEPEPSHRIVDGHHRVRAVRELNTALPAGWAPLKTVPAVVIECTDAEAEAISLGMGRYRGDLNLKTAGEIIADIATSIDPETLAVLSGFSGREVETLIESVQQQTDTEMPNVMESVPDEEQPANKFVLEIEFGDKDQYKLARRKLRRVAGKGGDLGVALLSLLGET